MAIKEVAAICMCILCGCSISFMPQENFNTATEASRWFKPAEESFTATTLLVHGFNQRPSSLDELANTLTSLGHRVYRLALPGHDEDSDLHSGLAEWDSALQGALSEIKAERIEKPVFAIGYSLGGLLLTRALTKHAELTPDKVVLIAPALSTHAHLNVALTISHILPGSLILPSFAPKTHRRYPYSPVRWYSALVKAKSEIQELSSDSPLTTTPFLFILSEGDELISQCGIKSWMVRNQLTKTELRVISPKPLERSTKRHLITDSKSLGSSEWSNLISLLSNFFHPSLAK